MTGENDKVIIQSAVADKIYVPQYEPKMLYVANYPAQPISRMWLQIAALTRCAPVPMVAAMPRPRIALATRWSVPPLATMSSRGIIG